MGDRLFGIYSALSARGNNARGGLAFFSRVRAWLFRKTGSGREEIDWKSLALCGGCLIWRGVGMEV